MNLHRIFSTSAVAVVAVLLSVGVQTLAYTAPSAGPTGGDADAPLNVGSTDQTKNGNLSITGTLMGGRVIANAVGGGLCINLNCITAWPRINQGAGITLTPNPITYAGGAITGTVAADTTYVQRRVSGTCTVGSSITAVAADGTVVCGPKVRWGTFSKTSTSGNSVPLGVTWTANQYGVTMLPTSGNNSCIPIITARNASAFTFSTGSANCDGITFVWTAIGS